MQGSLYRLVKRVIDEWDLVDLLSHAPPDEYDPEIREITRRMTPSQTPEELAESIERVFVTYFGEAYEHPILSRILQRLESVDGIEKLREKQRDPE